MKKYALLSLGSALLLVSCTISARTPSPMIPVTGKTAPPATPEFPAIAPFHGSALHFDGRDDYVLVPDDPSLDLETGFTIAAWIYLEEYTEWASIVTKGNKPNINNYAIQQSGPFDPVYKTEFGKLRFSGCVGLTAPLPESETTLSLRKWHFVAVTFDGIRISFYVDGKPDGSGEVQGPLCTNNEPLYIGVDFPLTTEYWHGAIDELRIWNSTFSESQIQDAMKGSGVSLDTLVGDWSFDESGVIARDHSGHVNDGLLVGNPTWIRPGTPTQ